MTPSDTGSGSSSDARVSLTGPLALVSGPFAFYDRASALNPLETMCERCSRLLSCKELAGELRKSPSFIYAMVKKGFPLTAGLATLAQALDWLASHPHPRGSERVAMPKRKTAAHS